MRILFLNHNVKWKSTFHRCIQFARHLVRAGHSVDLMTISPTAKRGFSQSFLDGVRIIETPDLLWGMGRSGWDFWDTFNRLLYVRGQSYDLVHAFDSRPAVIYPALLKKYQGAALFSDWADWWGRGGVVEERSNWLLRTFFTPIETHFEENYRKYADGLTVISTALQGRAEGMGIPSANIRRISGGADVETVRPLPKRAMREKLGISPEARVIGFSGFVHYDLDLVVEAFAELDKHLDNAVLLVTGAHSPLLTQLKEAGKLRGKVIEAGMVEYSQLPEYLACVDVFALPFANKLANVGRWPNKVGDYLAAGRPVVSNPVGDIKRLFEEEQIGRLAAPNPKDFAAAMLELLNNPAECEKLGANARQVAEQRLAWSHLTGQLLEHYTKIVGSERTVVNRHLSSVSR